MSNKTAFQILFFGMKEKAVVKNKGDQTHDLFVNTKVRSFGDIREAEVYARQNLDKYISPNEYCNRSSKVYNYKALANESREESELHEPIRDDTTKNLDGIVNHYCETFASDTHMINFMFTVLSLDPNDRTAPAVLRQVKFISDILERDCREDLRQFYKDLTDKFLREQIELRINELITKGTVSFELIHQDAISIK